MNASAARVAGRRYGTGAWLAALAILSLVGCQRTPDHALWREEVKLSDGEMIVIEREERYTDHTAMGGPTSISTAAAFVRPVTPPGAFPEWTQPLVLQVLDRDPANGEYYAIGYADFCESWEAVGRPPSSHLEYRIRDGRWVAVPLDPRWVGRRANVLVSQPNPRFFKKTPYLDWATKASMNADPRLSPDYLTIQPFAASPRHCGEPAANYFEEQVK